MFYKRISDLHPLGYTKDNWESVHPIPIPDPGEYYKVETNNTSSNYDTKGEPSRKSSNTGLSGLDNAFNNNDVWYNTEPSTCDYITSRISNEHETPGEDPNISSDYFAKSLWFEVGITKKDTEQPTSIKQDIKKYQSKRVNAYLLFTNIDEISAKEISAQIISTNTIYSKELSSKVINATTISTNTISADYGNISSLNVTSITADAISSYLGIINNISGDNIYYKNGKFNDIEVTGVANLTAEAAYWADVAEIYTADKGYLYGTLVKFGGEKEITLANDKANAVVSEKPAITLNSGNKEENALPIVLTGRSKVRIIHPVKKFDKIYLSETPGVGSVSSYKISSATMPIGIALESKPYDEEGLIECILQLNFE